MSAPRCSFCAEQREYQQPCGKCRALVGVCGGCCAKPIASCGGCAELKCFRCLKGLPDASPAAHVITQFRNCRTRAHSYAECADCLAACARKLVASADERFCFICLQELKRQGILYLNERLDCAARHEAVFCAPCHKIFKRVEVSCPACAPPAPGRPRCVLCLREGATGISILPVLCAEQSHKLQVCLDCAGRLERPQFPCRYCLNKEVRHLVLFRQYRDLGRRSSLLGCRLISNRLRRDNLAVDPFCCPQCDEFAVSPLLVPSVLEFDAKNCDALLPCAAVCRAGDKALLAGGFDAAAGHSSADCWLVHFRLDGRFRQYDLEPLAPLVKRRNAHAAFFHEGEQRFYALGGVCKDDFEKMEYLDSVECLEFDPRGGEEDSFESPKWARAPFKLSAPRAHFSTHFRDGKLYLFGGVGVGARPLKSIEVIDFAQRSSSGLVFQNAQLLPTLQPSVAALSANRLLIFGCGKEASGKALEFDFEHSALSIRTDKAYSVSGSNRVYLAQAFDRLIALSGTDFGAIKNKSKTENQLKFRVLGGNSDEKVVDRRVEGWPQDTLVYDNQYLFSYLCVEFGD